MALSALQQFEVRQTGNDANSGGFKSTAVGTDYTLQDNPHVTFDGTTIKMTSPSSSAGTTVNLTGYTGSGAAGGDIGNTVRISGTGTTPGVYEITGATSSTWTLDRNWNTTTVSAGAGAMGGALATPGAAAILLTVSGQRAWVKYSATPYACSTSTAGAAGPISLASGIACVIEGYDVTRGDRTGNRPTYQWTAASPGANTYLAVAIGNARQLIANIAFDANNVANVSCVNTSATRTNAVDCVALNALQASTIGFNISMSLERCQALSCVTGFTAGAVIDCVAISCTTGFSAIATMVTSQARSCGTGFLMSGATPFVKKCLADSCTTYGFSVTGQASLVDCLASNNTGSGVGYNIGANITTMINCAYYNNHTDIVGTPLVNEPMPSGISVGADPFVSQATGDLRPNANSPGGAQLRGMGLGVFGQTDNADIGAVQHADPVSSGPTYSAG